MSEQVTERSLVLNVGKSALTLNATRVLAIWNGGGYTPVTLFTPAAGSSPSEEDCLQVEQFLGQHYDQVVIDWGKTSTTGVIPGTLGVKIETAALSFNSNTVRGLMKTISAQAPTFMDMQMLSSAAGTPSLKPESKTAVEVYLAAHYPLSVLKWS